jgi:UDP:flavonoid glycosyltransferase YjiC (YdhE family)
MPCAPSRIGIVLEPTRTVLFTWELGANLGHIVPLREIADRLSGKGWRCVFALCDLESAYSMLGAKGYEYVQAPASRQLKTYTSRAVSFADELTRVGYSDAEELAGLIQAWEKLFSYVSPDVLVADLSPTATLVARSRNIPAFLIGNGYSLPPEFSPWPAYSKKLATSKSTLTEIEARVEGVIRKAGELTQVASIDRLSQLFPADSSLICSVPELDHYERKNGTYVGSIAVTNKGCEPRWPVIRGNADVGPEPEKLFLYLNAAYPLLSVLMQLMTKANVQVVGYVSGLTDAQRSAYQSHNLWLSNEPINVDQAIANCRFAICHGGNLTQSILLSGVPVQLLPMQLEQATLADRISSLNLGVTSSPNDPKEMGKNFKQLLVDQRFQIKAKEFAQRNAQYSSSHSFDRMIAAIEAH